MSNEQQYYEQIAEKEYNISEKDKNRFQQIADMLPLDVKSIVDIGTADGYFLNLLSNKKANLIVKGVERSNNLLELSKMIIGISKAITVIAFNKLSVLVYRNRNNNVFLCNSL